VKGTKIEGSADSTAGSTTGSGADRASERTHDRAQGAAASARHLRPPDVAPPGRDRGTGDRPAIDQPAGAGDPVGGDGPVGRRPPGARRRRTRTVIAGAVVLALVGGGWATVRSVGATSAAAGTGTASTMPPGTTTAKVTTRDLIERTTVDGTLGYGDAEPLGGPQGTVTATAPAGATIDRGQTVVEVNGVEVPLFFGTVPLWRPLSGAVAKGPDIAVLEENLRALGFADGLAMTVDETWDDATLVAVDRWQAAMGHEQTGTVAPGDVMVHDGPARIAKVNAKVGQPAQGANGLVEVTGTTRNVQAKVKASQQSLVKAGDAVVVELPGRTSTNGHITKVGSVAAAADSGNGGSDTEATLTVDISLDDAQAPGSLDQAPVSVKVTTSAAKGVLAVPVNALLALREGGYAVEVVRGSGGQAPGTQLVGVKAGAFADGWVQITGDVHEGDTVVVPR
jgi:hypothetical protein